MSVKCSLCRRYVAFIIGAASSEFGNYRLCEQRRFRRACASAQSRQNLRCSVIQAVSQRGTFRQKARSLAPLNGWAYAVTICHDGMLEDTNSLDAAHRTMIACIITINMRSPAFLNLAWIFWEIRNKWLVYIHILDMCWIIWTPFWFISVFESTAYLKFPKLQYVFLWLSLPGHYRVTDEALLAETT